MSVISYNGLTLPYAFTTSFIQEPVYDEVGRTDHYCTRFDITVQCVLNANYLQGLDPAHYSTGVRAGNAADVMGIIRPLLMQPRKSLSFKFNNVELIPQATGGSGTCDVRNGPQPQSCTIMELQNATFYIQYRIIGHYWENNLISNDSPNVTNRAGGAVLYNRWTETIDIDQTMFSKRIREGTYQIRSDNDLGAIADEFREQLAILGIPTGFVRESCSYTQTPDGLAIRYRIIDKEVYKMPPGGAYESEGEYIESGTIMGVKRYGEVRVKLKGCKNILSKQDRLVELAVAIAAAKLQIRGATIFGGSNSNSSILEFVAVMVDLYNNVVECRMRAMINAGKSRIKPGVPGFVKGFRGITVTPFSPKTAPTPPYFSRGTAGLVLQAAAYFDPDLGNALGPGNVATDDNVNSNGFGTQQNGVLPGRGGVEVE